MQRDGVDRTQNYILARQQHPAWQLLAGRRAPLVLACLQTLFESGQEGVDDADAQHALAALLRAHAGQSDFEIEGDIETVARKELRTWIRRALIVERDGRLYATDALESALRFVDGLENRVMTSTASRLAIVQREIERLEARLNPDPQSRVNHLRQQIAALQLELEAAEAGRVDIAEPQEAAEGARELYALATSLRADFRRVEDSWRQADLRLRQAIVSESQHRGTVVDTLLNGHDELLETPEGRVFHAFHQQLQQEVELEAMKWRLKAILQHPNALAALTALQQADMRGLVTRLVKESGTVIRTRSRSERDVRSFLRTSLAAEHHRVGQLLTEVLGQAQRIDWQPVAVRRAPSPLPPVAAPCGGLPLIERLRFKAPDADTLRELDLKRQSGDIGAIDDDFWSSFDGLDRDALVRDTVTVLQAADRPLSLGDLAQLIPPTHDLESLAVWVGMAREVDAPTQEHLDTIDLITRDGKRLRFSTPLMALNPASFVAFTWEP
jgi:uncharacterized small protein (DUF1192 family)